MARVGPQRHSTPNVGNVRMFDKSSLSVNIIFYSSSRFFTKVKITNKRRCASIMWRFADRRSDEHGVM